MAIITAAQARTRFSELLDRIAGGEEIVITRHEKPVARIVLEGGPAPSQIQRAANELHTLRREIGRRRGFVPLTDEEIRRAVDEGRP